MKQVLFSIVISAFMFSACEEVPPVISPIMGNPDDTSGVQTQQRQVLIEEFTGVRCVNCPAGTQAIQSLLSAHGDQLVAVSIHAGFFSDNYPQSLYDFQTPEGNSLLAYLGEPLGFPTAVVNRKLFDGEQDLQLGQSQWPYFIGQELATPPSVKIDITPEFNAVTRVLKADIDLFIEENIAESDVRLSVMITENGIVDYQLTPDALISNYVHLHVLRDMMTNYDGNPLTEPLVDGAEISKSYTLTLPDGWVADNCHIVAFVHFGGGSKEVLQAQEEGVSE